MLKGVASKVMIVAGSIGIGVVFLFAIPPLFFTDPVTIHEEGGTTGTYLFIGIPFYGIFAIGFLLKKHIV